MTPKTVVDVAMCVCLMWNVAVVDAAGRLPALMKGALTMSVHGKSNAVAMVSVPGNVDDLEHKNNTLL